MTTNEIITIPDYGADAGVGSDDIEIYAQRMPRLTLLQQGSQQCLRGSDAYLPGAQPGMLVNSLTKDLYDPEIGLELMYIYAEHSYVAWPPRTGNTGTNAPRFVASKSDPKIRQLLAQANGRTFKLPYTDEITGEPLELVNTKTAWVLYGYPKLTDVGGAAQAQISFTGFSLNTFDEWELALSNFQSASGQRPPCWASIWKLSSKLQSNTKGQSWFTLQVAKTGLFLPPSDPLYALGRELRTLWVPETQDGPGALGRQETISQEVNF
jgi:hypothetical protein